MKSSILTVILFLGSAWTSLAAERPNVLVILTDDQGWGDLSLNGNTNLRTPNIDSLAADGASFDRFYVCPVCSPTRAEFLTGRYHARSGVYSTSAGGERMNADESTIGDTFRSAGYATGAFGKWHNGMQYPYHPNGRGFEEFYGFCSGHWGDYFSPPLERNGELVQGEGFIIDDLTDKAMAFMEKNKDKPFIAYVPYNTPHSPMQVPDRWWHKFKDRDLSRQHRDGKEGNLQHTRAALAMCENIDWNVGRLLKQLDDLKIADNTIVVYFCDNGPNGVRWNDGMKGRKGSTDEGGVRSPLLIRWPDKVPAGKRVSQVSSVMDLRPTLASLAEIPVANNKPLDGIDLKPFLTSDSDAVPDRLLVSHWRSRVSVRAPRYRLDDKGKLYDIVRDPGQHTDLSSALPSMTAVLKEKADVWRREVLAGYDDDQRPFVIGHPDYRYTQIPARDGIAHGKIRRSNRFPNCSYFTAWTQVEDKITWTVEVGAEGDYTVDLYYACAEKNLGSEIELRFNESVLTGKVTIANDPPLRGGENDRSKRTESYVKDFKPMRLGTMSLKPGQGDLTLRALEKPGDEVMEFRLLMLTRVD